MARGTVLYTSASHSSILGAVIGMRKRTVSFESDVKYSMAQTDFLLVYAYCYLGAMIIFGFMF